MKHSVHDKLFIAIVNCEIVRNSLLCFSSACHAAGLSKRRQSSMISAFPYKIQRLQLDSLFHFHFRFRLQFLLAAVRLCSRRSPLPQGCVCECVKTVRIGLPLVAFIFHRADKTKARAIERLYSDGSEAAPRPGIACTC